MKAIFYKKEFNGVMCDFVRIPSGQIDILETKVRPQDIQNHPKEWSDYKAKERKPVSGTPMIDLPGISEDKRIELELKGLETIEQLAKVKKSVLDTMGSVYGELQRIAELHIKANTTKPSKKTETKETTIKEA